MAKLPDDAINIEDANELGDDHKPEVFAASRHWQVIWPRVIAKAWDDEGFKNRLVQDPRQAIWDDFRYKLSPELDLKIVEDKDKPGYQRGQPDPWKGLGKMKLELPLPPPPPLKDQAIALADYSDTGRTYPMTSG